MKPFVFAQHRSTLIVVGIVAVALHLLFCFHLASAPSEGSWQWFPAFVVDFPASLLTLVVTRLGISPLIAFATIGSLWWFFLAWVGCWIYWGVRDAAV